MKIFILTSLFWLIVLGGVLAARSGLDRAQWTDFKSDAVFSMSQFMERIAKQEDSAKRSAMATEMGSAMKEAHDLRELKSAIVRVSEATSFARNPKRQRHKAMAKFRFPIA